MTKKRIIKKRPMFDKIITTANREMATASGVILADTTGKHGKLYTTQTVLRVGEHVPDYIKPGTIVEMDMTTFPKKRIPAKHDVGPDTEYIIPPLYEDDDGSEFMLMSVRNLLYVVDEGENEESLKGQVKENKE
jgi:co-chaperonin GroES (HSP10)